MMIYTCPICAEEVRVSYYINQYAYTVHHLGKSYKITKKNDL